MKPKTTHYVFLEWEDHCETPGDNLGAKDIADTLIVHTAGMFVKEDKKVIKLSAFQNPLIPSDDNRTGLTIIKKNIRVRTDIITKKFL